VEKRRRIRTGPSAKVNTVYVVARGQNCIEKNRPTCERKMRATPESHGSMRESHERGPGEGWNRVGVEKRGEHLSEGLERKGEKTFSEKERRKSSRRSTKWARVAWGKHNLLSGSKKNGGIDLMMPKRSNEREKDRPAVSCCTTSNLRQSLRMGFIK